MLSTINANGIGSEARSLLDTTHVAEEPNLIRRCFSSCPTISPILVRSLSFGMTGVVLGAQFSALGKILASYGSDGEAASGITTSLAVFVIGTGCGFMTSTGVSIAGVAKTDMQKIGMVIRVAWCWGAVLGVAFAVVLEIAKRTFLSLFEHDNAVKNITGDFFAGFALSIVPDIILLANGITAFQIADKAFMPPASLALYRVSSIIIAGALREQLGG